MVCPTTAPSPNVYYINLAHRADRRAQVEAELERLSWANKATRVEAVHVPERGALGCALSHAHALRAFLALGDGQGSASTSTSTSTLVPDFCVIAEDDVTFVRDPRPDFERFLSDFNDAWDVCMLASNTLVERVIPERPYVTRVIDAQTTACYAVTRAFAPTLLASFEQSADRLSRAWSSADCCDIYWKRLQPTARWYCLRPRPALQRESFSDIEGRITWYGV